MNIRLGYIGVEDTMELVLGVIRRFPDIQCYAYPHSSFEEIGGLMKRHEQEVDMWLFSGPLPYETALREGGSRLPMFYIPFAGEGLYRTLFTACGKDGLRLERLSFDVFGAEELAAALRELGDPVQAIDVKSVRGTDEEMTLFHYEMWKAGRTDAAVTCVWLVQQRLLGLGVPVYRVAPTVPSIEAVLEKVLRTQELRQFMDMQIAVQLFETSQTAGGHEDIAPDGEDKPLGWLEHYAKLVQGSLKQGDGGKYAVFCTRGSLKEATSNFTSVPVIPGWTETDAPGCGVGIGRTAIEAEALAEQALAHARRSGRGSWMVSLQDKTVIGPLGRDSALSYEYVSEQARQTSGQTALSAATLGKLDAVLKRLGTAEINAYELAEHMQIMPRSARRILSELEASGIAVVIGDESPHPRGRPRKRYRIEWKKGRP